MRTLRSLSCLTMTALLASACTKEVPIVELKGECGALFTAQVCTWARMRGDSLVDAGAVVPIASIEQAPKDQPMVWPPVADLKLPLPASAMATSGFTQLTVYWEAGGHPPAPFMTPHFDFHFYVVPAGGESAIDCTDHSKPSALPADYSLIDQPLPPDMAKMTGTSTLVGLCVPKMGMHALPTADIERKDAFTGDMVIGYYGTKPLFIEPMLSQAKLLEKKSFDLPIPTIPGLRGNYPRSFHAEFDEKLQSYRFVFSGFAAGS